MIIHYLFFKIVLGLKSFVLCLFKPQHWSLLLRWYGSLWGAKTADFESQLLVNSGRYHIAELNHLRTPLCAAYEMLVLAGVNSKSTVVDLGAGTGSFILASLLKGASDVHGVELQGALYADLQRTFAQNQNTSFIKGDVGKVSLPEGTHYVVGWTTWRDESRKMLEKKLNLLPSGVCVWTFTHELSGAVWLLQKRQKMTFPGFCLEVFLYEKS